ncbi:dioxygenase [Synechococcus sp. Nb3U1]|uniref:DODA-type extradiol aromatic ring-opening family dioxygenase n=1 Tax=Synechococcus sp. Nb3U1 TaxID=1914529 RepID=UPI001F389018|nr:class III extradiol ring-cleavage dioxygenase [Synechococcus sp. Nb3U1]MCF2970618.1 dioxygenase [Synechococcus sp. Nb3U1]
MVQFLRELGSLLPNPRALLVISAHWETPVPTVSAAAHPATLHDFYGFPPQLYQLRYPAPGDPALAARVKDLLDSAGIPTQLDPARGLDHGAWNPLLLTYPEAQLPVLQLSIQPQQDPAYHYHLGQALQPLREEGVLILASGGATHNLQELIAPTWRRHLPTAGWGEQEAEFATQPPAWVKTFDQWLADTITTGQVENLLNYRTLAPEAVRNHPRDEHLLPLFVAAGAGGSPNCWAQLFQGYTYGVLSMAAFRFGNMDSVG